MNGTGNETDFFFFSSGVKFVFGIGWPVALVRSVGVIGAYRLVLKRVVVVGRG